MLVAARKRAPAKSPLNNQRNRVDVPVKKTSQADVAPLRVPPWFSCVPHAMPNRYLIPLPKHFFQPIFPRRFEAIDRQCRLRAPDSSPVVGSARLMSPRAKQKPLHGGIMKYLLILAALMTLTAATPIASNDDDCCGGGSCCPGGCCAAMTH
jgi:hypothetical protein